MKGTGYLLQATLILLWWLGLSIDDRFFNAFQFPNIGAKAFNSFFLPDILIIAVCSIIRAYKPLKELEFVILGGFAYAAFYCINASLITQGGFLATISMILGLFFNLFLIFQDRLFRESGSSDKRINGIKTLIQIVCVWSITLIFFPWLILQAFDKSLLPQVNLFLFTGLAIFILSSILGLASAFVMVKAGQGTPLPLDQTTRLVIRGPYRWVRNPMAIAGIGQGIAISIIYTSLPIFIYAILGAVLWQVVVRPVEEQNLKDRFGGAYEDYRKRVPCWIPKL
jgi:protein-S-isoprenylcysteine O-methyltransferase Ste14